MFNNELKKYLGNSFNASREEDVFELDKPKEECGVFGIYNKENMDSALLTYYALYALQHRGQESAGIAVNGERGLLYHKDMGLVPEIFNQDIFERLKGKNAVGHVRYSASGENLRENAQPMVIKYKDGQLAIAYNGSLVNTLQIRERLEEEGIIFQSTIDPEVILNLISRYRVSSNGIEESIIKMMGRLRSLCHGDPNTKQAYWYKGSPWNKAFMHRSFGRFLYICVGNRALDAVGAKYVRDVKPGEIAVVEEEGLKSIQTETPSQSRLCIFEHIYFARPDSYIDGVSVYRARVEAGRRFEWSILWMRILFSVFPTRVNPCTGVFYAIGHTLWIRTY